MKHTTPETFELWFVHDRVKATGARVAEMAEDAEDAGARARDGLEQEDLAAVGAREASGGEEGEEEEDANVTAGAPPQARLIHATSDEDMTQLALNIKRRVEESKGLGAAKTLWIGIAGIPGAGKSTVAQHIHERLEKLQVRSACVPMDGYHFSKAELDKFPDPENAHFRRGAPFTFNSEKLLRDIKRCQANPSEPFAFPGWSHEKGDPLEGAIRVDLRELDVVLVEGNYLLLQEPEPWPQFQHIFDETWFVDVDLEVAVDRVCRRNARAFNWPLDKTMARVRASDQLNMIEVLAPAPQALADLVIRNPPREPPAQ